MSEEIEESSILVDGKYKVPMLWSPENVRLPNNHNMALKRFNFLKKRLQKDTKLHQKYKEAMTGYLKKGYASYQRKKLIRSAEEHGISPIILFSMRTNQIK